MTDTPGLVRHLLLLQMLSVSRRGVTLREMADETGSSQRTITRDLNTMRQAGLPVVSQVEAHGRKTWQLDFDSDANRPVFTFDELAALYLGRRLLDPLIGTSLQDGARKALQKIRAALPEGARKYLEKLAGLVHRTSFGAGDYTGQGELVDLLFTAIEDRRITSLTYHSQRSTEPVTYEVYPYGLVFHRDSLYLVARSPEEHDNEIRHFKVNRVVDVDINASSLPFNRPADFNLQEHLTDAFGIFRGQGEPVEVRIRFAAQVARYVEESRWHASQQLTTGRDGSVTATFTLDALEEVQSWVLSFGHLAEVLEPDELRERVKEELKRSLAVYEPSRPRRTRKG
ncbi:MAG: YafY family transcriptional regulator [Planctomycetaceae bacterium]|nr:YafY family transcriptional regulator [Planctomycetaceae bacterium]